MDTNQRNEVGTRQALARARNNTGASSGGTKAIKRRRPERESPEMRSPGAGYGGMGYGPTQNKAMDRTRNRADPSDLAREVLSGITGPTNVQGSLYDDPYYAQMAEERGSDFAMRARNLDRKVNAARTYQQGRQESMQRQFDMEGMKRANARDEMAFQNEAAAYGSPEHVSQAYGGGAYKDEEGNIIRPGGSPVEFDDQNLASSPTAATGAKQRTLTGQPGGPDQKVGEAPPAPEQAQKAESQAAIQKEAVKSIGNLIEGLQKIDQSYLPDDQKAAINEQIQTLSQQYQQLIGGGDQSTGTQSGGPQSVDELFQKFREANPDKEAVSDEDIRGSESYQNALKKYGLSE